MYPIREIREQFLGLSTLDDKGQLPLLFDGPGGSQLPKSVVDAQANYLYRFNSNLGGYAKAGRVTQEINEQARNRAALWLGCQAKQVIFGLNSTSLMFQVARSLSKTWQAGDNIVVSAIDHFSHVSSWQTAARDCDVEVRFLPLVADGSELDLSLLDKLIDGKTRLVAVSLASNVLGSKTKIAPIIELAHAKGALVSVDAVHAIVHETVDVEHMTCDLLFASAYKIGGAHLGMCYLSAALQDVLQPYKVEPATNVPPHSWEQGTQSFEAQVAFIALMDYWIGLARKYGTNNAHYSERQLLEQSYQLVYAHEQQLINVFLEQAKQRPYVVLYGHTTAEKRTPTFAFNLLRDNQFIPNKSVSEWMGARNVALPSGNFYALGVVNHLNIGELGFLRAGFLHYSCEEEVYRLFELLDEYMQELG